MSYAVTTDATIDEKCPSDSSTIDGICKCNYEHCVKPECEKYLNLITNYTVVPGSCCPRYSCDECPKDAMVDDKCQCAKDALLNDRGICECIDPHKTIKNNECVCDENLCELPNLCDDYSVPVKYTDGCCENYQCIPCPEDSEPYPTHEDLTNDEIESKCVCMECQNVTCEDGQVLKLLKRGNGFPNNCCDLYECHEINKHSCTVNGTIYQEGETWSDNEDKCQCRGGISFCFQSKTYESCEADDGTIYPHDGRWDIDNCTYCRCVDGVKKCISHMCDTNISYSPHPVCPSMELCKKTCEYGYKMKHGCEICKCKLPERVTFEDTENATTNDYNYNEELDVDNVENVTRFTITTTMETTTNATLTVTNHPNVTSKPENSNDTSLRLKGECNYYCINVT